MLHLPTSSSPTAHQPHIKDDINNGNLNLSSTTKVHNLTRLPRTNSHLDKALGTNNYGIPMRSESYRSSRLDYALRPRNISSQQRNYVNSKTSYHDMNGGELYTQDENIFHQQPMNTISSTQRLNGSSFDLTANRKIFPPNKSNTINITGQHNYYNSTQELYRSGTITDRNNLTRIPLRDTTSKEPVITTPKYRQTSSIPVTNTATTTTTTSNTPAVIIQINERHPSAQSYKSRDPNISYAYTDVKKYIEENDLMSSEKEQIIRNWITDVEKNRQQFQKIE